ncbi:MAG: hypothetical protein ACSHYB_10660 [Roseibacillus sp.]
MTFPFRASLQPKPPRPTAKTSPRKRYLSELEEIGGANLVKLAQKGVTQQLKELAHDRLISLRLFDEEETAQRLRKRRGEDELNQGITFTAYPSFNLTVTELDENGNSRGNYSDEGMIGHETTSGRLRRYDHLFAID